MLDCDRNGFKSLSPKLCLNYCASTKLMLTRPFKLHVYNRYINFYYSLIFFKLINYCFLVFANLTGGEVAVITKVHSHLQR
jgi:hypothetical protein